MTQSKRFAANVHDTFGGELLLDGAFVQGDTSYPTAGTVGPRAIRTSALWCQPREE
ncbi:hypothetical protein BX257_0566 [Streptomyces sp. 3212.3]|nr:hypothetical protein BX257_0566 [Streptomyces sp. 3212.3]